MHRDVNLIVIHCSASANGKTLFQGKAEDRTLRSPAQVIDAWHEARDFHRSDSGRAMLNPKLGHIGYHYVIDVRGTVESGRHLDEAGAHTSGHNKRSVGICMVGTDRFTETQWAALRGLVLSLKKLYPAAKVMGHRDLSPDIDGDGVVEKHEWLKTCPGFDVARWLVRDMQRLPENTFLTPLKEPL